MSAEVSSATAMKKDAQSACSCMPTVSVQLGSSYEHASGTAGAMCAMKLTNSSYLRGRDSADMAAPDNSLGGRLEGAITRPGWEIASTISARQKSST